MAKEKAKKRTIPLRNYLIVLFLLVGAAIVTIYSFQLYKLYKEEKYSKSYLMTSKTIQNEIRNLEELDSVLTEANNEYFLYISYTGDKEVYDLEVDLKKLIDEYNLKEKFYFLNITDIKNNENYLEKINSALNLEDEINKVPVILYYKDNELSKEGIIIREDENILQSGDFAKYLDQYEFQKNANN